MNPESTKLTATSLLLLAGSLVSVVAFGPAAFAGEGFSSFRYVAEPQTVVPDPWAPVATQKLSLINAAPLILPYLNNTPSFGVPGTVVGSFWDRTQVTGDWGGSRTELARLGFFFDVFTTSTYQNVTSGGVKTGDAFFNNTQISVNIDTGRAGLWSGGFIHFTAQARSGSAPEDTFTVGSHLPHQYGLLLPGPELSHDIYPSDYYVVQALTKELFVIGGVISGLFLPDQTLFGNSYKYSFTNFNFLKNPFFANFYGPTALAALGVWAPTPWLVLEGGVLDPNTKANNVDPFNNGVNLYAQASFNYAIGALPGQFSVAGNWTNKPKVDLTSPFGPLSLTQIPQALGALLGSGMTSGLPINYKSESWFAIANFSQYLYVIDDPTAIKDKLKSGQPLRGIGVFGRFGYSPKETNPNDRNASIALQAYGLFDTRRYDSFGVGFYYNHFSDDLKNSIARLTANTINIEDEKGVEVYYSFAITPAIRLIPSYQHIWNPLIAQVETKVKSADVFMTRLTVAW